MGNTKLNQIIALEKGVRTKSETALTGAHRVAQKPELFNGFFKTYAPLDDEGVKLPGEALKVQATADGVIANATEALTRLFDIVATKDTANCSTGADIFLNGAVLVEDVPVTTLLWLEKKLVDLRTFVAGLPVLDPVETWTWDPANDRFIAEPKTTIRSRKDTEYRTVSPATDKHPAQVVAVPRDVVEGTWTTVKVSTAITPQRRVAMLNRVDELTEAVKMAREAANSATVTDVEIGSRILGYIFQ